MKYFLPFLIFGAFLSCQGTPEGENKSANPPTKTEAAKTDTSTEVNAGEEVKKRDPDNKAASGEGNATEPNPNGANETENPVEKKEDPDDKVVEPKKEEDKEPVKADTEEQPAPGTEKENPTKEEDTHTKHEEAPVEVKEPEPLQMPEQGTKAWEELLSSASYANILDLLDAKLMAKPKGERDVGEIQALVSAYVSLYVADKSNEHYLTRADKLYEEIKFNSAVDTQWKRQIGALILQQTGEPSDGSIAAAALHDAYLEALNKVPFQVVRSYHRIDERDDKGFFKTRMMKSENRENEVYTINDKIKVAVIFQYLKGTYVQPKDVWNYSIGASAQLFEEDLDEPNHHLGKRIASFSPKPAKLNFADPYSPDKSNVLTLNYTLPQDLKTNQNYVLAITVDDLARRSQRETTYLTIKLRPNRVD